MKPALALTCGDPSGVGPELSLQVLQEAEFKHLPIIPIGPANWLRALGREGIAVGPSDFLAVPGKPCEVGQRLALAAMEVAAQGCLGGSFSGVVTGPVNKAGLAGIGFSYPGQTEFFAQQWGGEPTMAFAGGRMTVALATWHIPLRDVPAQAHAQAIILAAKRLATLRQRLGDPRPKIGICGLNPHAGETGQLGNEETTSVTPAIAALRAAGIDAHGPLSGDTAFARHLAGEFDGLVALYHDQGLAPLKTVDFAEAANLTLGLPFIRTSPDHGTAYALAGTGKANPRSLASALRLAYHLSS